MVFDPAKLAASLTTATGLPYDSQHLPITAIRFVKNEGSIQFEVNVPRDAVIPGEKKTDRRGGHHRGAGNQQQDDAEDGAVDEPQQQGGRGGGELRRRLPARNQKQLAFEYELATGKLALLDDAPERKPAWASISPDDKSVVFARNHNLYMMDAENYAKALKNANDATIKETQLSTDGVEDFGYGGRGGQAAISRISSSNSSRTRTSRGRKGRARTTRARARRRAISRGRAIRRSSRWCAAIRARFRNCG